MRPLALLLAWLEAPVRLLVIAAMAIMVAAVLLQVFTRYVLGHPLGWTEELARLAMVWWTFVTAGLLAARRRLLTIDALLLVLGPRAARLVTGLAHLVATIVTAWLTWLAIRLVGLAGTQITPALDIPYAWVYLSLPVGMAIATLGFAVNLLRDLVELGAPAPAHPVGPGGRSDV
jgi:TRAP-type C4-dicarboxylate transport system permease small subunit